MTLSDIEAVSSLALIFEKEEFLQTRHLIVASDRDLEKLKTFFHFKPPKIPWYDLPPFPKPKSPYSEMIRLKRRKWQAWAKQNESQASLFLASPQALLKKTNNSMDFHIIKTEGCFARSVLTGYKEKSYVEREGEFSSRAFLIDIFSPAYDTPLRVQLLGDQIQSIHLLDKSFKKRQTELSQALIPPIYEWGWSGEDRKKLCDHLRKQEKLLNRSLPSDLFKNFSRGEMYFGFENLLNCLDETCSLNCFSQLPQIWMFEPERARDQFLEEQYQLEKEHPFFISKNLFLSWDTLESIESTDHPRNSHSAIKLGSFFPQNPSSSKDPSFPALKEFSSSVFKKSNNSLKEDLKKLPVHHIVFAGASLNELKKILLKERILSSSNEDFFNGKNLIFLPAQLKESFFCSGDTAYLRAEDFLLKKKQNLSHFDFFRRRAKALEFSKLEPGDLLVHRQHGIGAFAGLQAIQMQGKREDFIVLNYKDGDKLFVPAYKASQIKKYSRKRTDSITKTLLDRLGNPKAWERKKSQAKKHIQNLAVELIELYRLRKQKKRKPFDPVQEALKNFAEDFPWKETLDQKRAIQEIMADMDKDQPMDRLLTADTGFGKTEVALRAGFRALENGFQVCLLAPTTILTLQHFKNFKERFKSTPCQLALLSRFVSKKQKEDIFQKVRKGEIDFLIATHAVFSPQLVFNNLGLLILDEEHRFGVRQKERLFRFRENLDVLSLSATPIPRTLNMALTGIKDISVISQPPAKRKPVKMLVKGWDEGAEECIIQACHKEKKRGGQILFVHNRVRTLYQRAEYLQKLFPHFRIAVAKGQMNDLDKIMLDFFEKKYDLLVSTNIIESGMDIPQANTLFIDRAHEMGLSQIYQLKGRVGRGELQASCFLLFPEKGRLSVLAKERLELLEKYAGLGDAFQLALNDLENRGAGSLFGSEQSGHLQSLGEDLYFEILNEELKNQTEIFVEPEIRLPFATGIPENYISEPRLRLLYYKNLSSAGEEDRRAVRLELLEEFGPFPEELSQLFFLLEVRDFCKKFLITDFKATKQSLSLTFHEQTSVSSQKILNFLQAKKGQMLAGQTCKVPLPPDRFIPEVKQLLKELSEPIYS